MADATPQQPTADCGWSGSIVQTSLFTVISLYLSQFAFATHGHAQKLTECDGLDGQAIQPMPDDGYWRDDGFTGDRGMNESRARFGGIMFLLLPQWTESVCRRETVLSVCKVRIRQCEHVRNARNARENAADSHLLPVAQ